MIKRKRRPSAPGEILQELYLTPHRITQGQLATAMGISRKHINQLIKGHQRIEPETAVRLARVIGSSPDLWLNLQRATDVWDAEAKLSRWKPKPLTPMTVSP